MPRIFMLLLCLAAVPSSARADQVIFTNAERLIGRIVKMENKKVLFKSDMLGELTIAVDRIKTITTDRPVHIYLKDGSEMRAAAVSDPDHFLTTSGRPLLPGRFLKAGYRLHSSRRQAAGRLVRQHSCMFCEHQRQILYPAVQSGFQHHAAFPLQLGSNFEWQLNNKLKFLLNMTCNPSISDLSDYCLSSDAEIRLSLTSSMYGSFKAIFDYDSTPGEGSSSTDVKYIAGGF